MSFLADLPPTDVIPVGTLCIVIRDDRNASLLGAIVEVVGHIDRPATAAILGDHLIETRHGDRYITWGANLRPINPLPATQCARREPMREAA